MERRAALWIIGAFCIFLLWGVKTITSLISIHFHLNKSIRCHHLGVVSLPKQCALNSLLDTYHSKQADSHCMVTSYFNSKQCLKIESPIMNTNNYLN